MTDGFKRKWYYYKGMRDLISDMVVKRQIQNKMDRIRRAHNRSIMDKYKKIKIKHWEEPYKLGEEFKVEGGIRKHYPAMEG